MPRHAIFEFPSPMTTGFGKLIVIVLLKSNVLLDSAHFKLSALAHQSLLESFLSLSAVLSDTDVAETYT